MKTSAPPDSNSFSAPPRRQLAGAIALIVIAAALAYANTLHAPFIFDDYYAVVKNTSIHTLWPPWEALSPPVTAAGATGRPLVNLSFAINYAIGGLNVESYHVTNVLLHIGVALALFGLVRRTLELPVLRPRFGAIAFPVSLAATLVWTVHPLLTESVACVVQRNELMVAGCYLLVLYCVARAHDSAVPRRWLAGGFAACAAGMWCKEVMVSAPLAAFAYQALLIDSSWQAAWTRRRKFFLTLTLSWLPLAWVVLGHSQRDGTVGFGLGIAWWEYALTQCRAIFLYLKLSFWPHPLVADYGNDVIKNPLEVWPQIIGLAALLGATIWATLRKRPVAFAALAFLALLAPSSSILPLTTQTIAEHRMYLPLAAVLVPLVAWVFTLAGRRASLIAFMVVATGFGVLTARRNSDYYSPVTLWRDTIVHAPNNARAYVNLGSTLADLGRFDEALRLHEQALRVKDDSAGHTFIAVLLERMDRLDEAEAHYREAARLDEKSFQPHYSLGTIYVKQARWPDAETHLRAALKIRPAFTDIHDTLGVVLAALGRHAEAVPHFETAVKAAPDDAQRRFSLATALSFTSRTADAIAQFQEALRLDPTRPEAHFRAGALLAKTGRRAEAIPHYQAAVRLAPDNVDAHFLLGLALGQTGRRAEALQALEAVKRLRPDYPDVDRLLAELRSPPRR